VESELLERFVERRGDVLQAGATLSRHWEVRQQRLRERGDRIDAPKSSSRAFPLAAMAFPSEL
jgi:hypothetical protein